VCSACRVGSCRQTRHHTAAAHCRQAMIMPAVNMTIDAAAVFGEAADASAAINNGFLTTARAYHRQSRLRVGPRLGPRHDRWHFRRESRRGRCVPGCSSVTTARSTCNSKQVRQHAAVIESKRLRRCQYLSHIVHYLRALLAAAVPNTNFSQWCAWQINASAVRSDSTPLSVPSHVATF
jgi:hypothetical protein